MVFLAACRGSRRYWVEPLLRIEGIHQALLLLQVLRRYFAFYLARRVSAVFTYLGALIAKGLRMSCLELSPIGRLSLIVNLRLTAISEPFWVPRL